MDKFSYPRFQYSFFLENGAQVVIRGDDFNQFKLDIEQAKIWSNINKVSQEKIEKVTKEDIEAQNKLVDEFNKSQEAKSCEIHNTETKINRNGKPYHMRKLPNGETEFCNTYGYPSEKK